MRQIEPSVQHTGPCDLQEKNQVRHADLPATGESTEITIIVVSDYEASARKCWNDELRIASALKAQDIATPFAVVFAESAHHRSSEPPEALFELLPDAKVQFYPSASSAGLKDMAVQRCSSPWVVVLEADCVPERDWMRRICEQVCKNEGFSVFSGRTHYGNETAWSRTLSLLDRSFDDLGFSGDTTHVSNNAALYKTDLLKKFPYPHALTPFLSSTVRSQQMRADGNRFLFVREAVCRHRIGGIGFLWDLRQHKGYAAFKFRDGRSLLDVVRLTASQCKSEIASARRVGWQYLKLSDWPLWLCLLFLVRLPEAIGMVRALTNSSDFRQSAWR